MRREKKNETSLTAVRLKMDGWMDTQKDGRTDGHTLSYRDARTHLDRDIISFLSFDDDHFGDLPETMTARRKACLFFSRNSSFSRSYSSFVFEVETSSQSYRDIIASWKSGDDCSSFSPSQTKRC